MAFDKQLLSRKITEAGISQVELANRINVTPRTVSRWLHGQKPPKPSLINELAKALHCRPEDFDPRYADGENDIRVEGRVSAASHNAYATMNLVYGVDEQTIIELAPVLFSIVAARAMNLPEQDAAFWKKLAIDAESLGFPPPEMFRNFTDQEGFAIDEKAARNHRCFGLEATNPVEASPRNLFIEAMRRMVREAGLGVSMDQFASPGAGETPTALGFNPHVMLFDYIAEEDAEIVRKLVRGDVRLALSVTRAKCNANGNLDATAEIIRKDLAEQAASHRAKLAARREEGLAKLTAWRAFYQERHPSLAAEYDDFVIAHCKPEGWYPDYYNDVDREEDFANPFAETRFLDDDLLRRRSDASEKGGLWLSFNAPETRRFRELEKHRRFSKAEFAEIGR